MESSKDALQKYKEVEWHISKHLEVLDAIVVGCNEDLEGNCFYDNARAGSQWVSFWWMFYKRVNLVNVILTKPHKKVGEIGLNAGHSALLILHSMQPDTEFIVFDLNNHKYSKKAFEYLSSQYPQVREMIVGDSTLTLPQYVKERTDQIGTYDIIHVDGGHSQDIVISDIFFTDILLKSGGIMILDDTNIPHIQNTIERLLRKGYTFLHQLPTFGYMHCFLVKP